MIYQVRILSRIPADDGSGETILKSRELYVDGVALAGVTEIRERMAAANIADVIVEAPQPIEMATTAGVSEAVDDAMRERYGTGAANLAEIETRDLRRAVINQGKTLQALAEGLALLTKAVMTGHATDSNAAAAQLERIPVLRAAPAAPRMVEIDTGKHRIKVRAAELEEVEPDPSDQDAIAGVQAYEERLEAESDAVRAARALIDQVDGKRQRHDRIGPAGDAEVRLAVDESTAPPQMVDRAPDGRLTPRVPVVGRNGDTTERLGAGAAGNVMSQGWGVSGGVRSNIERVGEDGKMVAGKLPTVGESLRVRRSDIE